MVRDIDEIKRDLRKNGVSSQTIGAIIGDSPSMVRQRLNGYCPLYPEQRQKIEKYLFQLREARVRSAVHPVTK